MVLIAGVFERVVVNLVSHHPPKLVITTYLELRNLHFRGIHVGGIIRRAMRRKQTCRLGRIQRLAPRRVQLHRQAGCDGRRAGSTRKRRASRVLLGWLQRLTRLARVHGACRHIPRLDAALAPPALPLVVDVPAPTTFQDPNSMINTLTCVKRFRCLWDQSPVECTSIQCMWHISRIVSSCTCVSKAVPAPLRRPGPQ